MRLIDADAIKYTYYVNGDITVSKKSIDAMPTVEQKERIEINANEIVAELMEQYDFSKSIDKSSSNYLKGFADGKRDAQKHGHWKSMEIKNNDMYGYLSPPSRYIHECSKCGNKIENYVKKCNIKYCDTCGAEMDEVTE